MLRGMDPFTNPDSADIAEILTDSAVRLLRCGGLLEFSISAMARDLSISKQALNERFASRYGPRRRILQLVLLTFGQRWTAWVAHPLGASPPAVRLPESEPELTGVRVWTALHELARGEAHVGNPHPSDAIARIRADEADIISAALRAWTGAVPNRTQLFTLTALADGMRHELAAPHPRLAPHEARELMARAVADLGHVLHHRAETTVRQPHAA